MPAIFFKLPPTFIILYQTNNTASAGLQKAVQSRSADHRALCEQAVLILHIMQTIGGAVKWDRHPKTETGGAASGAVASHYSYSVR